MNPDDAAAPSSPSHSQQNDLYAERASIFSVYHAAE
jgi:hypothetical protein